MSQPVYLLSPNARRDPTVVAAILFPAMAAGMGWGIRGQYGHETGAMIAGVLASLTLVVLFASHFSSLAGARAAALMAAAIGIGGSMTYGQTVGLTHDRELIGNWEALRWGMLGLALKGGLWIGFGGVFLGMGLSGKRYRFLELVGVMLGLLGLYCLGIWLFNLPYDPDNKILPKLYFSDHWYFEPNADLKPRREVWGGILMAWFGVTLYTGFVRGDRLAWRLSFWGFLAGALGFPGGQSLQSYHAWNSEALAASRWNWLYSHFNWWNVMETAFGTIWGAVLGFGVWFSRRLIPDQSPPAEVALTPPWEVALCAFHLFLLMASDFHSKSIPNEILSWYTQWGLLMTVLPVVGSFGGRFWPYLMVLPVIAAPIVQKSMHAFHYGNPKLSLSTSWFFVATIPLCILLYAATEFIQRSFRISPARKFAAVSLLLTAWLYFGLNTVFFDYAWPWEKWGGRTPNQVYFMVCVIGLTILAVRELFTQDSSADPPSDVET